MCVLSYPVLSALYGPLDYNPGPYCPWDFPGKNIGEPFSPPGDFPTSPASLALQVDSLLLRHWEDLIHCMVIPSLFCHCLGLPQWLSGKESTCSVGEWVKFSGWKDPLEKEMTSHSSILAWESPWTEEPGVLQSLGLQKYQTWLSYYLSIFIFSQAVI